MHYRRSPQFFMPQRSIVGVKLAKKYTKEEKWAWQTCLTEPEPDKMCERHFNPDDVTRVDNVKRNNGTI